MNIYQTKTDYQLASAKVFLLCLLMAFGSSKVFSGNLKVELLKFQKMEILSEMETSMFATEENPWILGYSDEKIKVHCQRLNCDGKDSYKLKIENLTASTMNISYKLWEASDSKIIKLIPFAQMEGVCASGYNYVLIEEIPASLKDTKIKISINYLP
jgi:hypothetical protein